MSRPLRVGVQLPGGLDRAPSGRPLRVGVQLPEVERAVRGTDVVAMARLAEDAGFDSVWIGEHLLYRFPDRPSRGPWEAWTMLAAIAASTTRIRLGPLVACTAFHNPAVLAKQAATLDEISGGRFVLGLGAGWNETEFKAFGIPFDHRIARFEEAFTIIRTLLREGAIDFDGRYYSARDCELIPRGPTPGGPPLLIGSSGERMLAIAVPHVDAWNAWYADTDNSPAGVAALRDRVDAACRAAGRDPASIERTVAVLVGMTGGLGRLQGDSRPPPAPLTGPPQVLAAGLRAYAAAGIAEVQLVMDPITTAAIEEFVPVLELLDRS
ncbi:MAG: LLM class flavin-dependent oxidoreductase [Chloroflexota bacterium]|nr:LLM class flavin-dependent oxidoreductase [Chloroflexota bacterium]